MTRMFKDTHNRPMKTWNPFTGCLHFCYNGGCWARRTAIRLKHLERYKDGFTPKFHERELLKSFSPGEFVAVSLMGDIAFALQYEVNEILGRICQFPETNFLLQTKNPKCFHRWELTIPPNVYLGTTIESNRDYHLTKAPPPVERFRFLTGYPHNFKFLSIEPIMDFDLEELLHWVKLMQPHIIEVGADNYHNSLVEPGWWKVEELLKNLRNICPKVIEKEGLERLR